MKSFLIVPILSRKSIPLVCHFKQFTSPLWIKRGRSPFRFDSPGEHSEAFPVVCGTTWTIVHHLEWQRCAPHIYSAYWRKWRGWLFIQPFAQLFVDRRTCSLTPQITVPNYNIGSFPFEFLFLEFIFCFSFVDSFLLTQWRFLDFWNIYLLIWLCLALVVACRIFILSGRIFHCGRQA